MLLLSERLIDVPVLSLQTGSEIARTYKPIIDPRELRIGALYVSGPQVEESPAILHISDIREASNLGYIIDNSEKIMALDGLVRLQEIIDLSFEMIGMPVYDTRQKKIGTVNNYTYEPESFFIQQLHISQGWLRSFANTTNIVSRQQIVAVTADKIIVDSPTVTEKISKRAETATALVNPFRRNARPDHEHAERD